MERINPTDITIKPIFCQHLAVYEYAREFAKDGFVLDAGCGEGYGTYLLAESANRVVGVDYSRQAIKNAQNKYTRYNLEFITGDLEGEFLKNSNFSLVCSFQSIEHLLKPERFLSHLHELLTPGGVFLLSTPNRIASIIKNPYHFREYDPEQLVQLLKQYFTSVDLFGLQYSSKVKKFRQIRTEESSALLKRDYFNLHSFLPMIIKGKVFDYVARKLSLKIYLRNKELIESITTADFSVSKDNTNSAIDLFAVCRK